jgi:hypothetical protein
MKAAINLAISAKRKTLMTDPRKVKKDILLDLVQLQAPDAEFDFIAARQIAERVAREALLTPVLLA